MSWFDSSMITYLTLKSSALYCIIINYFFYHCCVCYKVLIYLWITTSSAWASSILYRSEMYTQALFLHHFLENGSFLESFFFAKSIFNYHCLPCRDDPIHMFSLTPPGLPQLISLTMIIWESYPRWFNLFWWCKGWAQSPLIWSLRKNFHVYYRRTHII
jgi:hypothetical protein